MKSQRVILPTIVLAQFCCTSLWFAGNGVMNNLIADFNLSSHALGHLTTAVQLGFIVGTLLFAVLTIADSYAPSKVFFYSAICASIVNLVLIWEGNNLTSILFFRCCTGFFLAGIYPVGMKIASDYYQKGLGKALGFLVGALVIGTALPHLLKEITATLSWKMVIIGTSSLAVLGGSALLLLVADGPFRKKRQQWEWSVFSKVFKGRKFRGAAFGYFGHMWELYAFWTFVPVLLETYEQNHQQAFNVPLLSFFIIGVGGLACVLGGYLAAVIGTERTAFFALLCSCLCCLCSPWMFLVESEVLFVAFLLFWGMVVVADSPLFSTLVAQNALPDIKGTALTLVNCIGFSITIISIQLINDIRIWTASNSIYILLAIGPMLGMLALLRSNFSAVE